jgi:hypothetical protein
MGAIESVQVEVHQEDTTTGLEPLLPDQGGGTSSTIDGKKGQDSIPGTSTRANLSFDEKNQYDIMRYNRLHTEELETRLRSLNTFQEKIDREQVEVNKSSLKGVFKEIAKVKKQNRQNGPSAKDNKKWFDMNAMSPFNPMVFAGIWAIYLIFVLLYLFQVHPFFIISGLMLIFSLMFLFQEAASDLFQKN